MGSRLILGGVKGGRGLRKGSDTDQGLVSVPPSKLVIAGSNPPAAKARVRIRLAASALLQAKLLSAVWRYPSRFRFCDEVRPATVQRRTSDRSFDTTSAVLTS